ncbi:hypothetical protein [Micromonospora sp. NPDC023633]|uniref:hypothetical protein n=1 Tax=Micromonospora sp. NPDC023633 TaxID=3154320 RepID=UPI0033C0723B
MTAFDLGNLGLIVDRAGATPAPTRPATTPADPAQYPHTPWRPRVVADCGHIDGDLCTCVCDTTRDRIGVALAPEWLLEAAPATRWSQSGGYWKAVA